MLGPTSPAAPDLSELPAGAREHHELGDHREPLTASRVGFALEIARTPAHARYPPGPKGVSPPTSAVRRGHHRRRRDWRPARARRQPPPRAAHREPAATSCSTPRAAHRRVSCTASRSSCSSATTTRLGAHEVRDHRHLVQLEHAGSRRLLGDVADRHAASSAQATATSSARRHTQLVRHRRVSCSWRHRLARPARLPRGHRHPADHHEPASHAGRDHCKPPAAASSRTAATRHDR